MTKANSLLLFSLFFAQQIFAHSEECGRFYSRNSIGAEIHFLHQQFPVLHTSELVVEAADAVRLGGGQTLKKPADRISAWIDSLNSLSREAALDRTRLERVKKFWNKSYVTKPDDVPESLFKSQIRIGREMGHGTLKLDTMQRTELVELSLNDQRKSLEVWIDYIFSADSSDYPMWAKVWALGRVAKLGKFDPELGEFQSRSKGNMSPFPELNREVFGRAMNAIITKISTGSTYKVYEPEIQTAVDGSNFSKMYGFWLNQTSAKIRSKTVEGEWIKYPQSSDPMILYSALAGRNTGWCTANEGTAKSHLGGGDFYVYYSRDENNLARIPRVAIRMQGTKQIAEVRGVAKDQNLDSAISQSSIVKDKLKEFGTEADRYTKKDTDMKRLTEIESKSLTGEELNINELKFLYETDAPILGFGQNKDTRVSEIISQRNIKKDLGRIYKVPQKMISTSTAEFMNGKSKVHYGDLNLETIKHVGDWAFPDVVLGNIDLSNLEQAGVLTLPKHIRGSIRLFKLKKHDGLQLPINIGESLYLNALKSVKGLVFPKVIFGDLVMSEIHATSKTVLVLPEYIGGNLGLGDLSKLTNLVLPKNVGQHFSIKAIGDAKSVQFPESVGRSLYVEFIGSTPGLVLSKKVGGSVNLPSLIYGKGVILPEDLAGQIELMSLRSARGMIFPKTMGYQSRGLVLDTQFDKKTLPPEWHIQAIARDKKSSLWKNIFQ